MNPNISTLPGIYIHIPFCEHKCGYCDFYSVTDQALRRNFITALLSEIGMVSAQLDDAQLFDTIYFGGGTPSLLETGELDLIFNAIHRHFSLADDTEITLEANPNSLSEPMLKSYNSLGINRLSLGVQSFLDRDLHFLCRIHSAQEAKSSIHSIRKAHHGALSIDLIFALPNQTLWDWDFNLLTALSFKPEHISAYNLSLEKGTPFHTRVLNGEMILKTEEDELTFYSTTIDALKAGGYIPYEISNYARSPHYFSRHNYKYWNHTNYLGFGPSAHSFWKRERRANVRSVQKYVSMIRSARLPLDFTEYIDDRTLEFESIFLGLRTYAGLNLQRYEERFRIPFQEKYKAIIKNLMDEGMAEIADHYFRLTKKGMAVCDAVTGQFGER